MSIGNVAFITIALFMVHEFDEIIFIRRYIDGHARDRRYSTEMFIAGAGNYPSTESVAVMICEEFIVASLILLIGILLGSKETIIATSIVYALHLLAHIREVFAFPGWAPGSRSALVTFPLVAVTLGAVFIMVPMNYPVLAILTVVIGAVLMTNLGILLRMTSRVDAAITRAV